MLNERQYQIFLGSMLGDGCIAKNFSNGGLCRFENSQSKYDHDSKDKKSYVEWLAREFYEYDSEIMNQVVKSAGIVREIVGDGQHERYVLFVKNLRLWEMLEAQWYVPRHDHPRWKRRKIVPQNITLTPLSLCVWYMEDGSNYAKDANITLETQGFTPEEVDFLIERLDKDLSIKAKLKKTKKPDQFRIYVGRKSYFDFIEFVRPHVQWDCFQYKLDTSAYNKKPHRGETHSLAVLTEDKVKEIFKLRDDGLFQKQIAKTIGVSKAAISQVLSGKRWQHLGMSRPTTKKPRLSEEMKRRIFLLDAQGKSQNQIAQELNINQSTISKCLREVCHSEN